MRTKRWIALGLLILGAAIPGLGTLKAQAPQANARPGASEAAQVQALDINTATPAQLRALPGMGDAYVKRIIEGRPYRAKNQLVTRGILPEAAYERIVAHRLATP